MYYVLSKGRTVLLRDAENGKQKTVGPTAWVEFGVLPRGMSEFGDCDVAVRAIKSEEDLAAVLADNARMAEIEAKRLEKIAAKAPVLVAGAVADEVEPSARHARRRR